jgi:hypothetical protein
MSYPYIKSSLILVQLIFKADHDNTTNRARNMAGRDIEPFYIVYCHLYDATTREKVPLPDDGRILSGTRGVGIQRCATNLV